MSDVIMPALGMAQDTGVLVQWLKVAGDVVEKGDALFEVETDKATMEVEAQEAGFLTNVTAKDGDEVPVGQVIALISKTTEGVALDVSAPVPEENVKEEAPVPSVAAVSKTLSTAPTPQRVNGRVLASPKIRRLADERGLDLNLLAQAGHPQPFHVKDLSALGALAMSKTQVSTARRLKAKLKMANFNSFIERVRTENADVDETSVIASLAAASLCGATQDICLSYEHYSVTRQFSNPHRSKLGHACASLDNDTPSLIVRDLRAAQITSVALGAEDAPTLTLLGGGATLSITLECRADHMSAKDAVSLLTEFAGRMAEPLRHLL